MIIAGTVYFVTTTERQSHMPTYISPNKSTA